MGTVPPTFWACSRASSRCRPRYRVRQHGGKGGGACSSSVNGALQATTDFSADLIAAATTCKAAADAPWMCTFDVIAAVDDLNGLVDSLMDSVDDCQKK